MPFPVWLELQHHHWIPFLLVYIHISVPLLTLPSIRINYSQDGRHINSYHVLLRVLFIIFGCNTYERLFEVERFEQDPNFTDLVEERMLQKTLC